MSKKQSNQVHKLGNGKKIIQKAKILIYTRLAHSLALSLPSHELSPWLAVVGVLNVSMNLRAVLVEVRTPGRFNQAGQVV